MPKIKGLSQREQVLVELLPLYDWKVAQAGMAAGFMESYARRRLPGLVLTKVPLFQAIQKRKSELSAIVQAERNYTRTQALDEYDEVKRLALTPPKGAKLDLDAANTSIKGKSRLFGLDLDHSQVDIYPGRRPEDRGVAVQASKDRLQTYRETHQIEPQRTKSIESIQTDSQSQDRANTEQGKADKGTKGARPEGGAGGG